MVRHITKSSSFNQACSIPFPTTTGILLNELMSSSPETSGQPQLDDYLHLYVVVRHISVLSNWLFKGYFFFFSLVWLLSYPIHSCFSSEVLDVRSDQIRSTDPYRIRHDKLLHSYPVHIMLNTAYFLHLVYLPFR
jgi:hypothetical protein